MTGRMCARAGALFFAAAALFAQEQGKAEETASGLSASTQTILLWVNFAILMAGLVYLIKKYGGPYFAARSEHIQREIVEAAQAKRESDARTAEVERRLAHLEQDLAEMRAESKREMEAFESHLASRASSEIARIQHNAEREIAASAKAARLELKRFAAAAATRLAGEKIGARMTAGAQETLLRNFVRDLDGPSSRAQAN